MNDRPAVVKDRPGDELAAVRVRDLSFAWPGRSRFELRIEQFEVARGERLLLLGPSGSGKSTLLSLICGIAPPTEGTIKVLGQDLATMPGPARDRFRAEHYGVVFQMFNLLPYASPIDNVLLALSFAPHRRARAATERSAREEATRLLTALGLDDAVVAHGLAASLSVGQQQRVAVARALIGAPEIVVADEPTSALDAQAQDAFLDLLFDQIRAVNAALIMVSHDERLATRFDRVVRLADFAQISREVAA